MLVRTPSRWAVAIRRPDGSVHTERHAVQQRWPRLSRTVLRGPLALVDAVSIGSRALRIAMRQSTGAEITSEQMAFSLAPVLVGVLGVFVAVPGMLSSGWSGIAGDVLEAASRAAMLLVYLAVLARSATARRLFAYHGAEHMAIAAFERHRRVPTADEVGRSSPVHVRCGTDFVALFVIFCGVVFSFVPRQPFWLGGVSRVALVPAVAALAYETMRAAARSPSSPTARVVTWPGRALQAITTRRPADDQVEIALAALAAAITD